MGQPRTGGYGITLTAATTVIYFNNSYDLEMFNLRTGRIVWSDKQGNYVDIVAPDTVDEKILETLKNKVNLAQQVLGEDIRSWFSRFF